MRAIIITNRGVDVINVINFLTSIDCDEIATVMEIKKIKYWWDWMIKDKKCFVYLDSSINQLSRISDTFTASDLRFLIFTSPKIDINIFIASTEPFELLWVNYIQYKLYSPSNANVVVITGKKDLCRYLGDIYGLFYIDIKDYYNLNISFSKHTEGKFI